MKKILVINGPNLNFLGIREKNIYGDRDYNYLVGMIEEYAKTKELEVECFQSNHEGAIIDKIQEAYFDDVAGIVINPGAYTHYSYAIRDALASVTTFPKIEVHISDVSKREDFRQVSYIRAACVKTISGLGIAGYIKAMEFLKQQYGDNK